MDNWQKLSKNCHQVLTAQLASLTILRVQCGLVRSNCCDGGLDPLPSLSFPVLSLPPLPPLAPLPLSAAAGAFSAFGGSSACFSLKATETKKQRNTIHQGPVVQSVVSLTSSLRVISLTVLADSIHNILIFFDEKMWVAFALQKLLTFFQQKISAYLRMTWFKF